MFLNHEKLSGTFFFDYERILIYLYICLYVYVYDLVISKKCVIDFLKIELFNILM